MPWGREARCVCRCCPRHTARLGSVPIRGPASWSDPRLQPFLPCASQGTRELITKILWHTENTLGVILIHSYQTATVVLAVIIPCR